MRGIYLCALCESLPDRIIKLRTNFSHTKLIVKLTIQSHNLKSHKVLKSPKLSNSHNFILAYIYRTTVLQQQMVLEIIQLIVSLHDAHLMSGARIFTVCRH